MTTKSTGTRSVGRVVAFLAAIVMAVSGAIIATPTASHAAVISANHGYGTFGASGHLGGMQRTAGSSEILYCLQPDAPAPSGTTDGGSWVSSYNGSSAATTRQVNWAMRSYGQGGHGSVTEDKRWGAAVQLYVWSKVDPAQFNSHGYSGKDWYSTRVLNGGGNNADYQAVRSYYDWLHANEGAAAGGAAQTVAVTAEPDQIGAATVNPDGTITWRYRMGINPRGGSGTVSLSATNATVSWVDTGTTSLPLSGSTNRSVEFDVISTSTEKWSVSISGSFSATGGWQSRIRVHSTGAAQQLGWGGGREESSSSFAREIDDPFGTASFNPVATTEAVDQVVSRGDRLVDEICPAVADPASQNWRRYAAADGSIEWFPVTFDVVAYGPFLSPLDPSPSVPADAPVAGTGQFTTTRAEGPSICYQVDAGEATAAGHYTFVVSYSDDTPAETLPYIPAGYAWQDAFGLALESMVVPFQPVASTTIDRPAVAAGGEVCDVVDVSTLDNWLRNRAGDELTAIFDVALYSGTGELVQQSTVPADAELVIADTITAVGPGEHTFCAPLPADLSGEWVTFVVSIDPAKQDADTAAVLAGAWSHDFGMPEESAPVTPAVFSTTAISTVRVGEQAPDTLHVSGVVLEESTVTFAAYFQESGEPEVCEPETLIYESEELPITAGLVTDLDVVDPAGVTAEKSGRILHVATVFVDGVEVWVGDCGDPSEITTVYPKLADTGAEAGPPLWLLAGILPLGALLYIFGRKRQPRQES